MSKQFTEIRTQLLIRAKKSNTIFFEKMIPGKQKIYGVKSPVLQELANQYQSGSFSLARELWDSGSYEERVIAIKIMKRRGKDDPNRLLKLFKAFSKNIDNWAVCDGLGMQFLRGIVKTHSAEIFALAKKYSGSANMWQRRLSLVMVEWYTRDGAFHPAIKQLVKTLENDDEYYVKKAVVWIRKNFMKGK